MSRREGVRIIHRRTPQSAAMVAETRRAMSITARLNRLTFDDADDVRALFSELIGRKVDDGFLLIPPYFPGSMDDAIDKLVPALVKRGLFRSEYEGTTLRANLGLAAHVNRYERGK